MPDNKIVPIGRLRYLINIGSFCNFLFFFLVNILTANADNLTVNGIEGVSVAPFAGGAIGVRYRNASNIDISTSTQILWSIDYSIKTGCGGGELRISRASGSPAQLQLSNSLGGFPVGVYTYKIKAKNLVSGETKESSRYTITIKDPTNSAPVLTIPNDVDTTLDAGLTSLSHLELTGTATDVCTDSIISLKWEKLDGPSIQNYDGGSGKLILQNVSVGVYTFKLSATDDGNLTSESTITITIQKRVVSELTWQKAFSPNDDGIDDAWAISNISSNGDLYSVTIVNQQGKVVMDAKPPYANDMVWDGTQSGKPLPEGAYYFIITNKATREVKKGSILMVR
ncbi:gliding motility-associated C-terminal domain-containing protein [Cytophagaceae bacterium YF14B1]|uniref:Gliding motility-associated C-terminal domain-containing protein n=1 Tax=Xanthocytophaga flava TaxID=3048013 RepID=A0AAE3UAM7_9BACT|nr:gliding motility-associated C-terminal domain-containing protein [Xanthocytophaga flavus]MDJ1486314.1 gliding motility-associated C-terminal domain-containing protein [Xanthocytophaga flavus]